MSLSIECNRCGKVMETEIATIVHTLTDHEENNTTYTGFYCLDCYYELEADEED